MKRVGLLCILVGGVMGAIAWRLATSPPAGVLVDVTGPACSAPTFRTALMALPLDRFLEEGDASCRLDGGVSVRFRGWLRRRSSSQPAELYVRVASSWAGDVWQDEERLVRWRAGGGSSLIGPLAVSGRGTPLEVRLAGVDPGALAGKATGRLVLEGRSSSDPAARALDLTDFFEAAPAGWGQSWIDWCGELGSAVAWSRWGALLLALGLVLLAGPLQGWLLVVLAVAAVLALGLGRGASRQGLEAAYYPRPNLEGRAALRRLEPQVDLRTPWLTPGFPAKNFSARWRGWLHVHATGVHTWTYKLAGRLSVRVDGRRLFDERSPRVRGGQQRVVLREGDWPIEIRYERGDKAGALGLRLDGPRHAGGGVDGGGRWSPVPAGRARVVALAAGGWLAPFLAGLVVLSGLARGAILLGDLRRNPALAAEMRKNIVFSFIMLALVVALVEVLLRLLGLPPETKAEQTSAAVRAFVTERGVETPRPPGQIRIFTFGGSSVAGNPFPKGGFPVWMQRMFSAYLPDRDVRVVNFGRPGAASSFVARALEAALPLQPSVAIIYSGHNEFHERNRYLVSAFQAEVSTSALHAFRSYLGLRWLMTHFFGDLLWSAQQAARRAGPGDVDRFMAFYEHNLRRAIDAAQEQGVQVVLATVASNLRFPPWASEDTPGLSVADREAWLGALRAAHAAQAAGNGEEALRRYLEAVRHNPRHAATLFELGEAYDRLGRSHQARQAYIRARDLDAMPLRALSRVNSIVRRLAREKGLILVDVERRFEELSPEGIPGSNLFSDFCHPTREGYRRIAELFVETLAREKVIAPREAYRWSRRGELEAFAREIGISPPEVPPWAVAAEEGRAAGAPSR